jgi:cystathionine beta-lyase/cystathionine gamma-synthase
MNSEEQNNTRRVDDAHAAFETLAIHADRKLNSTSAVSPPIYQSATFRADSNEEFARMALEPRHDHFYTRYGNPTLTQAGAVVAALEGAETALLTASGMGAISTSVLTFVGAGDHVVAQQNHYGGTTSLLRDLLPRYGVEVTFVDQAVAAEFEQALRPQTKLMVVETPSNPLMRLTDLRAVAAIARPRGILTLADNTFATPINQRPLELGIDLVVHSGTKYMGGHSDLSAGAVVGSALLLDKIWNTSLILGSVLGPFDAWLLLRGLRTLPVRVERHNRTAQAVARFLETHSKVARVYYPGLESHPQHELARGQMSGFTGILSFDLKGGLSAAKRLVTGVRLASYAASVGGAESLIVCPAIMLAHQMSEEQFGAVGVRPGLVRLSVGLEHERDLISDLEQALAAA